MDAGQGIEIPLPSSLTLPTLCGISVNIEKTADQAGF